MVRSKLTVSTVSVSILGTTVLTCCKRAQKSAVTVVQNAEKMESKKKCIIDTCIMKHYIKLSLQQTSQTLST